MKAYLDAIAQRSTEHMRRERVDETFLLSCAKGVRLLPAGAALVLFFRMFDTPIDTLTSIFLAVIPYAAYVLFETIEAMTYRPTRGEAISRVDLELGLHDRLRIADEFMGAAHRDPFMDAAVADAEKHLTSALAHEFADHARHPEPVGPAMPVAAFLMLLLALMLSPAAEGDGVRAGIETARHVGETAEQSESRPARERAHVPPDAVDTPAPPPAEAAPQQDPSNVSGSKLDSKRGTPATGRTARTGGSGSQARSAESSGSPSAAGRASAQPLKKQSKESKPRRKKKPKKTRVSPRKKPQQNSGATSGSARSSGASKNPTASPWKTRDTPPDQLDEAEAEDQEVEDESEDSESRGGMQPNLRSKKPPANRDLAIGFGNRANRRSNGRGGASPQKKSRGTASLVLGVPVPDHIKGQPNPGMTKVTRERGEPEREQADEVRAGVRKPRSTPAGAVPRATPFTMTRAPVGSESIESRAELDLSSMSTFLGVLASSARSISFGM